MMIWCMHDTPTYFFTLKGTIWQTKTQRTTLCSIDSKETVGKIGIFRGDQFWAISEQWLSDAGEQKWALMILPITIRRSG